MRAEDIHCLASNVSLSQLRETRCNTLSRLPLILPLILAIVLAISASAHSARSNLLRNGGFEDGDGGVNGSQAGIGKCWETICGGPHPEIYSLDSRARHSGGFSQRMTCSGFNYRFTPDGGYCFHMESGKEIKHPCPTELGLQAIAQTTGKGAIEPGANYECSAWVKIDGLTDKWEWFRLGIYWLDSDHKFLAETREDYEASKGNFGRHDWKLIRLISRAPADAAFAKVYLHHHFVHGTVWYDDVSLVRMK